MLHTLTLTEIARRIRGGDLSSEALVSACLERIGQREAQVGAWQWLDAEGALAAARAADRAPVSGPLHGVPIGVKDIIDTHDMPTGLGFGPYRDRRPAWDAGCVALCRRAGAIVMGKTVTTEFAYFAAGKTRNPHDTDRTPGGSSSGSAAAVADAMVPAAFGSQTAASLTRPAAFCGVVGYKGSHGEFSLSGIRPLAESFDSLGVLTRSVEDVATLRDVLLGRAVTAGPVVERPRIGFVRGFHWGQMDYGVGTLTEAAIAMLADAGAVVDEIALPARFAPLTELHKTIMAFEAARNYAFEQDVHAATLSPAFIQLCEAGAAISKRDYDAAQAECVWVRAEFARLFAGYDAWIAPSALGEAPRAADGTGDPVMSRLWTLLRGPSVGLPIGLGAQGLPIGMQLVGPAGSDDRLIGVAAWAEHRLAWHGQSGERSRRHAGG